MSHMCPNCGYEFGLNEEFETVCKKCGFDFNTTIACSSKYQGKCLNTGEVCEVYGLDFEDCPIYLKKTGIL